MARRVVQRQVAAAVPRPHRLRGAGGLLLDAVSSGLPHERWLLMTTADAAVVSQHIGDMENAETLEHYERTLELYERLFRIAPDIVAYDLHPEYLSTKFALGLPQPKVGVQHHHAHIAGVAAEHGDAGAHGAIQIKNDGQRGAEGEEQAEERVPSVGAPDPQLEEEADAADIALLKEIRDELRAQRGA